jgi:hypothetical protein
MDKMSGLDDLMIVLDWLVTVQNPSSEVVSAIARLRDRAFQENFSECRLGSLRSDNSFIS